VEGVTHVSQCHHVGKEVSVQIRGEMECFNLELLFSAQQETIIRLLNSRGKLMELCFRKFNLEMVYKVEKEKK
jgi:hypothetical protein